MKVEINTPRMLWRLGWVMAFLAVSMLAFVLTSITFFNGLSYLEISVGVYIWLVLALVVGLLLAWRKNIAGAIIMALFSVFLVAFIEEYYSYYAWLVMGLPFLISAILLAMAWRAAPEK